MEVLLRLLSPLSHYSVSIYFTVSSLAFTQEITENNNLGALESELKRL